MNNNLYRSKCILISVILFGFSPAWSSPPNVVLSDVNRNTAGGESALFNTSTGANNTAFGFRTLLANGAGSSNTGLGASVLSANTVGTNNTGIGFRALSVNKGLIDSGDGSNNTAIGANSLLRNTQGQKNTATGGSSLGANTTGDWNTANGYGSLQKNITGGGNTGIGFQALLNSTAGNFNLALGFGAGSALTIGGNNIYLSNTGIARESSSIRIGNGSHTRTFISGIRGVKTGSANAVAVVIDSNGQLGTVNSSARFKKDIKDMRSASQNLMKLRPVTYRYKETDENSSNPLEYGLIAEEVAKIFPDLVAYGADGQIETVQYQKLTPMLVNELQLMNRQLETEKQKNKALADEVTKMKAQFHEVADLKNQVKDLQSQAKIIQVLTAKLSRMEAQQTRGTDSRALSSVDNRKTY